MNKSLKEILEAVLFAAAEPMSLQRILTLFESHEQPSLDELKAALQQIQEESSTRPVRLHETANGYVFGVEPDFSPWVSRLWEEKPQRYSRALLETLAIIAYRQPVTRGEIEDIRGVAVSSEMIKTLLEREWLRVVGQKDVPGRPSLYATTRQFLDYFGLKSLEDLPALSDLRELPEMTQLPLELPSEAENIVLGEEMTAEVILGENLSEESAGVNANEKSVDEENTHEEANLSS